MTDLPDASSAAPAPAPQLQPLMRQNFLEYASYVIVDRAIPDVRDGLKPVQRRLLITLFRADDGKYHKVANIIGETMKLHPHGDASIGEALVVLANKEYFLDKQGNFGNVITGHAAAAARYIECRLTPLAKKTLFYPALTDEQPSYDGRRQEPVFLPAKLPVALMLGTEGIAVGMATKILPHNFRELIAAQIAFLEGRRVSLVPDFLHGGEMDVSEYADGRGKVRLRAVVEPVGERKIFIRQIPFSTTCEGLIGSIEAAITRGKVKISSIQDFTTDKVEIELTVSRGATAQEVVPELFAYTDCEVQVSCNIVVIIDRHPKQVSVSDLLADATHRLREQIQRELNHELGLLTDRCHRLTLEQIFIEEKVYSRIERADSLEAVRRTVTQGMEKSADRFLRAMDADDVERLLELHIRRISVYDVGEQRAQMAKLQASMRGLRGKLKRLTETTIDYLRDLDREFGPAYPRRTRVKRFVAIDRKAIARADIKLTYDPATGFLGSDVRGTSEAASLSVSEFDLTVVVSDDGTYRILAPQPKVLVGRAVYWAPFVAEVGCGFAIVYRDAKGLAWGKQVEVRRFVRSRAYTMMRGEGCQLEVVRALGGSDGEAPPQGCLTVGPAALGAAGRTVALTPLRRRRGVAAGEVLVDLEALPVAAPTSRGQKLAPHAVGKPTAAPTAARRRGR